MAFMAPRAPDGLEPLAAALGTTPTGSNPASSSSAATRPAWATSAPTARSSTRPSESILLRPELAFTPDPPTREDLEALIEARW